MDAANTFMLEMLALYGIGLLGFFLKKYGLFNQHADHVFTQFVLYVTLPALILFSLNITFSIHLLKEFLWLIGLSIYILSISCLLAYWMRRRAILPRKQKPVYEGLIIFGNQGFIGFAVSFILLGEQGIIYVTIFNLCYLVLIWTYGIYLFSRSNAIIDWKKIFLNPGIVSTAVGILIFFLPITLPSVISSGLETVGKMTIPLSMMLIGMLIANVKWKDFKFICKNIFLWKATFMRLIIIPGLILPFIMLPIPFPVILIAVIVSGMPAAPTISLYAQKYGGDSAFGAVGSLLTTVLCFVTIPILYGILYLLSYY